MAIDYVLFIHGVNTREERELPTYADGLIKKINHRLVDTDKTCQFIPFYWGDLNKDAENRLLNAMQRDDSLWSQMWFRNFREKQILQFVGDAALYISRHAAALIVNRLAETMQVLRNPQPDDRLHLITHSWGTVILFDILFASRWDENIPGHDAAMEIRDIVFGLSGNNPNQQQGIQLASLHTMGSPITLFSLTNVIPGKDAAASPSTHDITPQLQKLLENLHQARQGIKLPWRNFIHPGDPVAYPLKGLMFELVNGDEQFLDIQDVLTQASGKLHLLSEPLSQTVLALLNGGEAHSSYWNSGKVATMISDLLIGQPKYAIDRQKNFSDIEQSADPKVSTKTNRRSLLWPERSFIN